MTKKMKARLATVSDWATMLIGVAVSMVSAAAIRDDIEHAAYKWQKRRRKN